MTTIVWRKLKDWTLQIAWDKRITNADWIYIDSSIKIINLDNVLVWKAWDSISIQLLIEIYYKWKLSKMIDDVQVVDHEDSRYYINSIMSAIDFWKYLKANCNIKNIHNEWWEPLISLMILHNDFQIKIDANWQITELNDVENLLSIWSWSNIVNAIIWIMKTNKWKYVFEIDDIFEIVSSMDSSTSRDYDILELKEWLLIHSN